MKIWQHVCNENKFNNRIIGSIILDGRYWLHIGKRAFNIEWYLLHKARSGAAFKFEFGHGDGDNGIMFHISIPFLFSIYLSFDGGFGKLFRYPNEPRETGISIRGGSIYFYPFSKINSWSSKDKWWNKYYYINVYDLLFGKLKYTEENSSSWNDIQITMPEGKYNGKLRLYTGKWKNRFITKRVARGEIEMYEGIPFPGKGENSWDCGEDASYGITCPARSESEAICTMIEHVLSNRREYGCRNQLFEYTPKQKYFRSVENKEESKDSLGSSCDRVS